MGNFHAPADRRKLLTILDFIVFGGGRLARMRDVPVRKRTASNELRSRGRGRVVRIGIPLRGPEVRI